MSSNMVRLMSWPVAGICALGLVAAFAGQNNSAPAKPTVEASRLDTYQKDGATYFALSLQPAPAATPATDPRDIVVLFDTSASQTGAYRDKALGVLKGFIATLGAHDRIHLLAVDINAVPMTSDFVPASGPAIQTAMAKLTSRVPLGSTDMAAALHAAAASFKQQDTAPRAAVYIGDGINNAGILETELRQAVKALVDSRVSTTAFAVGPQRNAALLAAVANQTGGMYLADAENYSAKDAGMHLSRMAHEPVIWVESSKLPKAIDEIYPGKMPPLRGDRDTILIGKGNVTEPFTVEIAGQAAGKPVNVRWKVTPAKPNEDHAYLVPLVEMARPDGGIALPTLGTAGLNEARRMLNAQSRDLSRLGQQAAATGDKQAATRFAREALDRDPENMVAEKLSHVAQLDEPGTEALLPPPPAAPPAAERNGDLRLVRPAPRQPGAEEPEPGFLESVDRRRELLTQIIMQDVTVGIRNARDMMATNPEAAETDLKLLLDRVSRAPELTPGVRAQLRNQLENAILTASQQVAELERRRLEQLERARAAEEQRLMLERLVSREQKVEQLIERMNALLAEQRYQDAELDAARIAYALDPTSPTTSNAVQFSRVTGYVAENMRIRDMHHKAVVDALALVDQANIPFVDEPPIVYPAADVWLDLTRRRAKYKAVDLSESGPAERRIYEALDKPTSVEFTETPLGLALQTLGEQHDIEIELDPKALVDLAITSDDPITLNVEGISLRSVLRLMLRPLQLTYIVDNEVLFVTSQAEADARPVVKVYPVADLVLPINAGGGVNPFSLGGLGGGGLGGGLGGGFGGGGFGGGGFGGGGFGGGGFGGGGLGGLGGGGFGGAFNVADEDARTSTGKGSPANTTAKQPSAAPRTAAFGKNTNESSLLDSIQPVQKSATRFRVELTVAPGADLNAAWDEYFKTLDQRAGIPQIEKPAERFYRVQEVNAAVREAARHLMNDQKFAEVVAMIQSALRHGYAQPWMYEGLGLAMQAANQSKSEIERALMSAVDFAANTDELMHAALYMARIGLEQRALRLFRQAANLEPTRLEPYMHGLALAERTGDLDAIRWVCTGVLSRAWPDDKLEVIQSARNLATATLERLRKEKKADEARQFETALNEALIRDLVVRVSWTGQADIDLAVEEPSGSVCSLENPRTIAGGALLASGSTAAQTDKDLHVEDYVVPQAFSGDYQILVRRVWGKVTAGKVTVDILSHYGTKEVAHQQQQIPLSDKDALVKFTLKEGRRKEVLEQAQVAVLADKQQAVGRAILAQQLDSMSDPTATRDLALARRLQQRGLPFFRNGGAVGFMPVITTLPQGTNMSATAVVSADRRYVRVSPTPLFSTIPEVNTFNFAGATGGGGGLGGGGLGGGLGGLGGGLGGGGLGGGLGGGFGGGGLGGGGFGGGGIF